MEELIEIEQLPIIREQLQTLKAHWDQMAKDASEMVCTEDTVLAVKAFRTEMRKEFEEVDGLRRRIKEQALAPWYAFESTFKDCVTDAYKKADAEFKAKIDDVESAQKQRCEEGLRDYFAELCAVRHLEWLPYERAGIKISLADAKAKTPKKLRDQLAAFVTQVGDSVDRILELEYSEEIMIEFQQSLDAFGAITTVQERHRRIEEEQKAQEERKEVLSQEAKSVFCVEALSPPVVVEQPEIFECSFRCWATMEQLKALKQFMAMEGIKYE